MSDSKFSFFIGTKQEYFLHDFKLEGSLLNDKASLVMESNNFRNLFLVGFKKILKIYRYLPLTIQCQKTLTIKELKDTPS